MKLTSLRARLLLTTAVVISAGSASAQESAPLTEANNPLADFQTLAVHNYYMPQITGADDTTADTLWLRYVRPLGEKWLMRASLPFSSVPLTSTSTESGLGDLNAFASRIIDIGRPGATFGVGPQLTLDTATEDATGTGKTQAGFAVAYFDGSSSLFQYGGLVTWQKDVAGSSNRPDTEVLVVQPFYFLQLGNGYYFRGSPSWIVNREADTYQIPIGAGIGRVLPTDSVIFNLFVEPQFTVLSKGDGQPEFQLFAGFNLQFR